MKFASVRMLIMHIVIVDDANQIQECRKCGPPSGTRGNSLCHWIGDELQHYCNDKRFWDALSVSELCLLSNSSGSLVLFFKLRILQLVQFLSLVIFPIND